MSEKIGLIADIHADPGPLREALALFRDEGVGTVLCAGDVAGYGDELEPCVDLLREAGCRTVQGNHDLWWLTQNEAGAAGGPAAYLRGLPLAVELSAAGKELYLVHASPPASLMDGIRLLDEAARRIGEQVRSWTEILRDVPYDVLVVGHTHQAFAERLGKVLVVNPGSTVFNHSCAVLTLPEMEVVFHPLSGKEVERVWNWGKLVGSFGAAGEE